MRKGILFLVLLAAGCSHMQSSSQPESRTAKPSQPTDTLCMQDCMGSQAGEEFCKDRCSF